jgi:hypothetical protein
MSFEKFFLSQNIIFPSEQCCGSGMFHSGSGSLNSFHSGSVSQKFSSRIPDPTLPVDKKRDFKKINPTFFLLLMVSGANLIRKQNFLRKEQGFFR